MKSLKSILEAVNVTPTSVKETSSYTEIWWRDLGVKIKNKHQQPLIDGYLASVLRKNWDDYDKNLELKEWEKPKYTLDRFSAYITQFGNNKPVIKLNVSGTGASDSFGSFNSVMAYILIENPDKQKFTTDELIEFCNKVIDKLNNKTDKVIKFLAKGWNLPNEYTDYNEFLKL